MLRKGQESKRRWTGKTMLTSMAGMLLATWMLTGCSASNGDRNAAASNGGSHAAASESAPMAKTTDGFSADASSAKSDSAAGDDAKSSMNQAAVADSDAAMPASAGSGTALQPEDSANQGFERKIVYRGNVAMEVESYDEAQTALRNLIHLSGGYLLNFSDQKTDAERGGTFTVKVPASGFDGFLSGLEKIEHASYESSAKGTDVTQEYVDLQARLKARQVVEARLLDFMAKATKTADLLQISGQLGDVQTEIEQIKGRIRYLDNNVAYSTIDLRLYEVIKPAQAADITKRGFGKRITEAAASSVEVMYAFLQGVIVVIAGALPVLAVLALIGIPGYGIYRKVNRKRISERLTTVPMSQEPAPPTPALQETTSQEPASQEPNSREP